jgi:hypothetical protein
MIAQFLTFVLFNCALLGYMQSAAVWRRFCGQTILNWKAINGSKCRTIQTKFHCENKSAPRNYLKADLKMFKLCNFKYHSCLSVIVSMRNLEKTQSPQSPIN